MKTTVALVLVLLASECVYAQTAADIQTKYGKSVDVYSVSEHIWMTPEYSSDGQVCRMRLYPKRISANTNYGAHDLPFSELRDVLNGLVPVETRGAKKQSFGTTATGGGAAWTTYDYENVTFDFVSFFPAKSFEGVILKRGEYVFPPRESLPTESNPSSNDFVER
ncbi:MAG TPA: hypothetical protein VFH46_17085, partial [Pyrinomonadaceae bacterium]|nr:hypothetical protein [Pyrinomonadaceae bacterium]